MSQSGKGTRVLMPETMEFLRTKPELAQYSDDQLDKAAKFMGATVFAIMQAPQSKLALANPDIFFILASNLFAHGFLPSLAKAGGIDIVALAENHDRVVSADLPDPDSPTFPEDVSKIWH
jgi:hypothetical protein